MTPRKTTLAIVVGAIITLTPPILVYLQGNAELQAKYRATNAEADVGYKTLVESVRELRATVSAQHDTITKMQGYLDALRLMTPGLRMTAALPAPQPRPEFHELPANLDAAQMKR